MATVTDFSQLLHHFQPIKSSRCIQTALCFNCQISQRLEKNRKNVSGKKDFFSFSHWDSKVITALFLNQRDYSIGLMVPFIFDLLFFILNLYCLFGSFLTISETNCFVSAQFFFFFSPFKLYFVRETSFGDFVSLFAYTCDLSLSYFFFFFTAAKELHDRRQC